jgi:hypothetical protein
MVQRPRRQTKISSVLPPITDGLTFFAPLTRDYGTVPVYSAAGTTGLSTETVDADGTYTEAFSDLIVGASLNTARVGKYGLLSEVASTNLCLQSEALDVDGSGSPWTHTACTVTANQVTAPDNAATADKVADDAGGQYNRVGQNVTLSNGTTYTLSVCVKKGDSEAFSISLWRAAHTSIRIDFEFTGTVPSVKAEDEGTGGVKAIGGGWYRCYGVGAANADVAYEAAVYPSEHNVTPSAGVYTYFWGVQLEAQSAPTSYIPTTSAAVTRSAEALRYPGGANVSFTAGTILVAARLTDAAIASGVTPVFLEVGAGATDRLTFILDSNDKANFSVVDGGASQASLVGTNALVADTTYVFALVWAANDVRQYVNGADEKSDTSATMPSGTITIDVGYLARAAGYNINGSLKHLLIYNDEKTAEEIAYLSDWVADRSAA